MPAISFEHVSKRYRIGAGRGSLREAVPNLVRRAIRRDGHGLAGQFIWALKDVSLQVEPAETLGIIGRNGAGKTTVLKLLSNITKPTGGNIQVNGRTSALIELGAGFHPDLTGRENIYLNASILGLRRSEIDSRLDDIIAFAELAPFIDTPVKRYSSGMYARLGFSVAAHVDPDVLLVDEVLAVGDIMFQQKCLRRIKDFQADGRSIVFISHNLDSIQKVCSRVVWLEEGRVRKEGDPRQIANDYILYQMTAKRDAAHFQEGELPLRYGIGDAEIERVQLLDAEKQERNSFSRGEHLCIQIEYSAARRVSPVNFFVIITNEKGIKLTGTDFHKIAFDELAYIEDRGCVQCHLTSLPFRAGAYFIIVGIEEDGRVLDRKGMVASFTVEPDPNDVYAPPGRYGLFDVESFWAVESLQQQTLVGASDRMP
jgi:lipopolysaccharide transport system ATP-binding protein